jgi:RNA polymerase sigma-70 factor, ECF subfamily
VPLEDQDRSTWDRPQIDEGIAILERALRRERPGIYQVQAAIDACHAEAPFAAATDWPQIALLYGQLARLAPGPIVELNRAVAVAMADGPSAGLDLVEALTRSGQLAGYPLLPATRADLLRRLGRHGEAADAYREALDLATAEPQRRYLERRLTDATAAADASADPRPSG